MTTSLRPHWKDNECKGNYRNIGFLQVSDVLNYILYIYIYIYIFMHTYNIYTVYIYIYIIRRNNSPIF